MKSIPSTCWTNTARSSACSGEVDGGENGFKASLVSPRYTSVLGQTRLPELSQAVRLLHPQLGTYHCDGSEPTLRAINDQSASQQTGPIRSPRPRWRVKSLGWRRRAPSPNVESLHLIERGRERRLWSDALFDFLAGCVRMLAVFQEARPLVFAEELNDSPRD